ncbi:MAG: type II secretion system F family protein [Oscillospiraceae bacterium]|nr:type II secretion system F family protein [Oscillospiraceae bacterium]
METFKYAAISHSGERVSGIMEGFNELDAVDRIRQTCDVILKLTPVKQDLGSLMSLDIGGNKLNAKAFTVMCSQFSIILKAGIPIARTVHLIAEKTTDKTLKRILKSVAEDVESGRSVADAFNDRGGSILPPTFVETIRAGEESGNLDRAFDSMYHLFDKRVKMAAKVRSALAYPLFVLVIAVAVVIVLMVKVVPTFTAIFDSYDAELPVMTRMLIGISNFFRGAWPYILVIAAIIALAYKLFQKTEKGRMSLAKLQLKLPILGNIGLLNGASQFASSMTTMLGAGLPITRAVSITARTMDNYYISSETGKLVGKLEEGKALGTSMAEAAYLPDILVDMVTVGEETGELEETMNTISGYYDAELEMATDSAMKKLEPALLIFMAVIAGFIVIAIYMAMFDMYSVM